jgi:hypothetical protein
LLQDVLEGGLASQPTISRLENSLDKHSIFELCYAWIDRYAATLKNRKQVVIDIDATDDRPAFYKFADGFNLKYAIGQASNEVLKQAIKQAKYEAAKK